MGFTKSCGLDRGAIDALVEVGGEVVPKARLGVDGVWFIRRRV
jgi:hypothetical protein